MCIRIYIFNLKNKKHKKIRGQKSKETKEEKIISVENLTGYGDIVCEFALCTFKLLDRLVNFPWLFMQIRCSLCATRKITVCFTTTTYGVHTIKNKNKRKSLRNNCFFHFLFYIYL